MPPADDYLLVCIEIDRLIGPASNITIHGYLFPSHGKIGNGSRSANIDPYLTYKDETGKLSGPSPVFRIKIRSVTIRTSIDNFNTFCEVLNLLETTNRTEYLL